MSDTVLSFQNLLPVPNLIHGIATASFGNMSFNYSPLEEVKANRRRFFNHLAIPEKQVVVASLEHHSQLITITTADWGKGIDRPETAVIGDILVTSRFNTFLFMVVADCLALLVVDPVQRICGLAHAGWRGVDQQVPKLIIEHFIAKYRSKPTDLLVGMSPALQEQSACYPTVEQTSLAAWQPYLSEVNGRFCVNSVQYAYDQLITSGVPAKNIERSHSDTRTDHRFFSHRRSVEENQPEGRFGCLIGFSVPRGA